MDEVPEILVVTQASLTELVLVKVTPSWGSERIP